MYRAVFTRFFIYFSRLFLFIFLSFGADGGGGGETELSEPHPRLIRNVIPARWAPADRLKLLSSRVLSLTTIKVVEVIHSFDDDLLHSLP